MRLFAKFRSKVHQADPQPSTQVLLPDDDVGAPAFGGADATKQWAIASQLLSNLRAPAEWFETVSESIRHDDGELIRDVRVKVRSHYKSLDSTGGDLFLVIQKPRKNVMFPTLLHSVHDDGSARLLSHREHEKQAELMIYWRAVSAIRALAKVQSDTRDVSLSLTRPAQEIIQGLVSIPSLDPATATATYSELFRGDWLKGFPSRQNLLKVSAHSVIARVEYLSALASELIERYHKIVKMTDFRSTPRRIDFAYSMPREDKVAGSWAVRLLRVVFNTPPNRFAIHVPWARLTNHYELRMEQIDGFYVSEQLVSSTEPLPGGKGTWGRFLFAWHVLAGNWSAGTPHDVVASVWTARPNGATRTAHVFIGDGSKLRSRTFVNLTYLENVLSFTGRAFILTLFSLIISATMVLFQLTHEPQDGYDIIGVIPALLGFAAIAADAVMPRAPVLNSPLLPRVVTYAQSALLLVLSTWIYIRGNQGSLLPLDQTPFAGYPFLLTAAEFSYTALTLLDDSMGFAIIAVSFLLTLSIFWRTLRLVDAKRRIATHNLSVRGRELVLN